MTTLYATLGVPADATVHEIKLAYRRAAMKWHPDRNPGREAESHAAFQQVRDAYAILSDAEQRQVYDDVFEREMRRWEAEHAAQEAEERQAQEQARRVAQEHYEKMVAIAMRFADEGHSRDVLFGILLGKDCETDLASQIADSVDALYASRHACAEGVAAAPADATTAGAGIPTSPFDAFWQGLFRFR
ncbi:putative heat shock protein, dnaJ domain [Cupriavidus taiwanensis]|uniref:Heat shock protein, dnaJ domain n=1 Tax=Cupriavidus taiwanensis TaxID=164546 RepID=A0A375C0F6_9BURK|nr:J domain-containing protein [Cupriavidus taiwanensis]SOY60200.1 putative heat shock protein, dnaJ domain [Cupriavidus taiwanensis]